MSWSRGFAVSDPGHTICIDASVGVKWYLRDEAGARDALALLQQFAAGRLGIVVPELFFYEVGNTMSLAVRRAGIPERLALAELDELERLHLDTVCILGRMDSALAFSQRFGVSFYDAAYLAAAESRAAPLITCDAALIAAVSPELDWVRDLRTAADQT